MKLLRRATVVSVLALFCLESSSLPLGERAAEPVVSATTTKNVASSTTKNAPSAAAVILNGSPNPSSAVSSGKPSVAPSSSGKPPAPPSSSGKAASVSPSSGEKPFASPSSSGKAASVSPSSGEKPFVSPSRSLAPDTDRKSPVTSSTLLAMTSTGKPSAPQSPSGSPSFVQYSSGKPSTSGKSSPSETHSEKQATPSPPYSFNGNQTNYNNGNYSNSFGNQTNYKGNSTNQYPNYPGNSTFYGNGTNPWNGNYTGPFNGNTTFYGNASDTTQWNGNYTGPYNGNDTFYGNGNDTQWFGNYTNPTPTSSDCNATVLFETVYQTVVYSYVNTYTSCLSTPTQYLKSVCYEQWNSTKAYGSSYGVSYMGKNYKSIYPFSPTMGKPPNTQLDRWAEQGNCESSATVGVGYCASSWNSTKQYAKGVVVSYLGLNFTSSAVAKVGQSPDQSNNVGWIKLGACNYNATETPK
ncbi:hypothetical protein BDR26DRAFT_870002 [Obelidium mucronatum]|nr:hypothetical protein BDR26DRAFT_870002 [Obelidium mucronatum]